MLHTTGNDCTYELGQDSYVVDGAEIGWVTIRLFTRFIA